MQEYLGPEIISRFLIHGTSVAEIIKNLITCLKKKDDDLPKIFFEALKKVWLMNIVGVFVVGGGDRWNDGQIYWCVLI